MGKMRASEIVKKWRRLVGRERLCSASVSMGELRNMRDAIMNGGVIHNDSLYLTAVQDMLREAGYTERIYGPKGFLQLVVPAVITAGKTGPDQLAVLGMAVNSACWYGLKDAASRAPTIDATQSFQYFPNPPREGSTIPSIVSYFSRGVLVLYFRGSITVPEFLLSLYPLVNQTLFSTARGMRAFPEKFYRGDLNTSMSGFVDKMIKMKGDRVTDIFVTGHSLGAAYASLCADYCQYIKRDSGLSFNTHLVACAPVIGNSEAHCSRLAGVSHVTVVCSTDPVLKLRGSSSCACGPVRVINISAQPRGSHLAGIIANHSSAFYLRAWCECGFQDTDADPETLSCETIQSHT